MCRSAPCRRAGASDCIQPDGRGGLRHRTDDKIKYGDTDYLKDGGGTHSGRSMRMGAIVLSEASRKIIARACRVAAHVLEAADIDIEYADAMFTVAGTDQRISLFDVAAAARNRDDLPDDLKGGLKEDADVYLPRAVIGSRCMSAKWVDSKQAWWRSSTGLRSTMSAVRSSSFGRSDHGSVLQGVGQAVEDCAYDTGSGQMIGATFRLRDASRDTAPPFHAKCWKFPARPIR